MKYNLISGCVLIGSLFLYSCRPCITPERIEKMNIELAAYEASQHYFEQKIKSFTEDFESFNDSIAKQKEKGDPEILNLITETDIMYSDIRSGTRVIADHHKGLLTENRDWLSKIQHEPIAVEDAEKEWKDRKSVLEDLETEFADLMKDWVDAASKREIH